MNKNYRQSQILKLIRSSRLHTQEDLAKALRGDRHSGHAGDFVARYSGIGPGQDHRRLHAGRSRGCVERAGSGGAGGASFVEDIRIAQNLLVLRTPPGHANVVAVALDKADWPEITGTVAGDDTILVIAPDARVAEQLRARFLHFLG